MIYVIIKQIIDMCINLENGLIVQKIVYVHWQMKKLHFFVVLQRKTINFFSVWAKLISLVTVITNKNL